MSYILDALRRADAERERGGVPSIHTQQQFTSFGGEDDAETPPRRLRWVVAGLVAALIAAVGWILLRPSAEGPVAAVPRPIGGLSPLPATGLVPPAAAPVGPPGTAVMNGANPAAPAPPATTAPGTGMATAPSTAPLAQTTSPATPPVSAAPARTLAAPAARAPAASPPPVDDAGRPSRRTGRPAPSTASEGTAARPQEAMPQKAAPERTAPERIAPETAATEKAPAVKPPAEKPAPSEAERVYAQRELPDDVRRALPPITVSGSTFSNDAASRMLMIGGQLYHEGDTVAPGVVLQRIKQRSAILAFRGYRYEMTF